MTQDMIALIILVPFFTMFLSIIIFKPSILLNLQKKVYKKIFDIEIKYSKKTERIIKIIGVLVALLSLFAVYMQLYN